MKRFKVGLTGILIIGGLAAGIAVVNAVSKQTNTSAASASESSSATTASAAGTSSSSNASANASLDSLVAAMNTQYSTKVGIVVTDTSTGHTSSTNSNEQFVSASLYKLYVAYGVLRGVDNGTIGLNDSLDTLDESVSTCLTKMITVSDNDCGKALGDLVGWSTLDDLLDSQGYTGTDLDNYDNDGTLDGDKHTTAADVSLLLARLYNGTLLSKSSNALFLNLLSAQEINTYLPSGFPASTTIAHKTGTLYGYVHDAGIVYGTNKNLIVVVMSGEWDDPTADSVPMYTAFGESLESYLTTY